MYVDIAVMHSYSVADARGLPRSGVILDIALALSNCIVKSTAYTARP
jgi:hypothetical protein